ncbi:unnamed protein product, partial [Cladocopium goreaui]
MFKSQVKGRDINTAEFCRSFSSKKRRYSFHVSILQSSVDQFWELDRNTMEYSFAMLCGLGFFCDPASWQPALKLFPKGPAGPVATCDGHSGPARSCAMCSRRVTRSKGLCPSFWSSMTLNKSASLPAILALGTTAPKLAGAVGNTMEYSFAMLCGLGFFCDPASWQPALKLFPKGPAGPVATCDGHSGPARSCAMCSRRVTRSKGLCPSFWSSMTLNKSASLPAILALGTTAPKLAGHEKQQSLRYATANDKKSAFATFKPADVSQQVLEYVMELQRPGWRQRATPEPEELPVTVEDLVPKNQRYPRVTPAWLKHEKQVLRFYAFFQETVTERADENSRKRHIIIMYYLEDGTVSMSEPRIENSGIVQGSFLKRQRVSRNDGTGFIGPEDLRCGIQITLFGRTYHITGCDSFTRWYYREIGVEIGENEEVQEDAWQKSYKLRKLIDRGALPPSRFSVEQKTIGQFQMGAPPVSKKLTQFLLNDRRVLRFKGYWDDHTKYGARLYFNIHYYLADNTMEFNEAHCRNSGRYPAPVFFKRGPLRKHNVAHCVPAMLTDESCVYLPEDLRVGDSIDVWGRKVVLFDCDAFTQKFYKEYLDLDQRQNRLDVSEKPVTHLKLTPPPHNGVGKEEDSLISTQMINVKAPKVDLEKLMVYTGEVLRFEAKMANGLAEDEMRVL